ncbi:hypothetical protein PA7_30290 [Pseudonocardia asaccharolytica DSM 44247 = NBRC 16224]|uniref:Transposase DDE domain-containing protein n=1 Tax=Pseudonocardia asaccharolytica DSM 44247 = NBRC 16224 TaxID=1123024 RepID=A0A511D334_9PSEU|nr:hypothetical protein PA7_30290 [Pseudonocardia asaccharolytica DSM 44247 = NBRC 16224]
MRLSHARSAISVRFDDPNLVSCVGLVPIMALAARCGLPTLLVSGLTLTGKGTANAAAKITALIGGMIAGADSIADLDLLRHGGMGPVFDQVRAPSTRGTFLRRFTFGHVRHLDAVAARLLARLAAATPLLPGADQVVFVDLDDTVRQTYGYAKQGAGRGHTGVKGLTALLAVLSTPVSAPVIAATRLRKGSTNSARGAARLLADALATARRAGAGTARHAMLLVHADSAYYGHDLITTCRRAGARFSVTARPATVTRAITSIDKQAWTPIRYPNAIYDDEQRWISDAEIAETEFTAFTGRRKPEHITARLIVRRVRRLNPAQVRPDRPKRSRSTATTRCSPTAANRRSPRRPPTATTRSSSRSSPSSTTARWRTCPRARSPRTPPGWPAPRSPTTSPAPPASWPVPATPAPAPRPCAPD